MDSRAAQEQTQRAQELAQSLAQSAKIQKASLKEEPEPDKLPAVQDLGHIVEVLGSVDQGAGGTNHGSGEDTESAIITTEGGGGSVIAYSEPHLQVSAPMGIGMATPEEAVFVSGGTSTLVAQEDLGLQAQEQIGIVVAKGASLYTVGAKAEQNEPNQERGIALHAASGAVNVQSQSGKSALAADQQVRIASTQKEVNLLAPQHVLLTAGGAYIKLEGSDIQIHAPGRVTFHAGWHSFTGPGSSSVSGSVGKTQLKGCEPSVQSAASGQGAIVELS